MFFEYPKFQIENSEMSLFFCSPASQLNSSMDLMNTSELPELDDSQQTLELESTTKSDSVFTFDESEIEQHRRKSIEDIQSRPLPPLPGGSATPEEPEDEAPDADIPEPEYACVDGDLPSGIVYHQRSISDHVLSYRQRLDEEVCGITKTNRTLSFQASATELKKSNSDRSERRSGRRKTTHDSTTSTSEPQEHQRAISCSTPSITSPDDDTDERKRSTTDSIDQGFPITSASKTMIAVRVRARIDNAAPNSFASVRGRDGTKSLSTFDPKQRWVGVFCSWFFYSLMVVAKQRLSKQIQSHCFKFLLISKLPRSVPFFLS